jgi:cytochrome b
MQILQARFEIEGRGRGVDGGRRVYVPHRPVIPASVNPPRPRSEMGRRAAAIRLSFGALQTVPYSKSPRGLESERMSDDSAPTPTVSSVVRVWDLPTRLFHWLLAVAVVAQVVTGKVGGAALNWHLRIGYCIFALLAFRLVWGLVGGYWSRFVNFVYGPASLLRYLRGPHRSDDLFHVGHSPLGSASVFAMLAMLVLQVATGLVADDEIATVGPLNRHVSSAFALAATAWHKGPGIVLILTLIALHVAAIAFYTLHRGQELVRPMVGGDKTLAGAIPPSADDRRTRTRALAIALACAAVVAAVVKLGG